jgi:hypothetical protein
MEVVTEDCRALGGVLQCRTYLCMCQTATRCAGGSVDTEVGWIGVVVAGVEGGASSVVGTEGGAQVWYVWVVAVGS